MAYHTITDIVKIRPDLITYGSDDYPDQIAEAEELLNRSLDVRWYRPNASDRGLDWQETPFNSSLVEASYVRRAACYKSIELIYMFLSKVAKEGDAFLDLSKEFRKMYGDELKDLLASGVGYDWDESGGELATDEAYVLGERRLMRR